MANKSKYNPSAGLFENFIFKKVRILSIPFVKKNKGERTLGYLMKCKRALKDAIAFNELQRDFSEEKRQNNA